MQTVMGGSALVPGSVWLVGGAECGKPILTRPASSARARGGGLVESSKSERQCTSSSTTLLTKHNYNTYKLQNAFDSRKVYAVFVRAYSQLLQLSVEVVAEKQFCSENSCLSPVMFYKDAVNFKSYVGYIFRNFHIGSRNFQELARDSEALFLKLYFSIKGEIFQ